MNTYRASQWLSVALLAAPFCGPAPADEVKRKEVGKNIVLEIEDDKRRVVVTAAVCLREGSLEGLLCKKNTKEHEYILAADVDARQVHAALLAAGAKAGTPVQFSPKYVPASGDTVRIWLRYEKDGTAVTVPAGEWVRHRETKKDLGHDWVFAGSRLLPDPEDTRKPPFYLANHGDMICLCNIDDAMLDLPVKSPKAFEQRVYESNKDRVPPLETKVEVILEPVPAPKK